MIFKYQDKRETEINKKRKSRGHRKARPLAVHSADPKPPVYCKSFSKLVWIGAHIRIYLLVEHNEEQCVYACVGKQKVALQTKGKRARFKSIVAQCAPSISINPNTQSFPEVKKKKKKRKEKKGREWMHFLLIYLSFTLFPQWERQKGINGSPLLSSLLGVGWQHSRWWFKQWIYEHHNLNVAERKEKDLHETPLTNALANINALLIHPICCLIAFLYTVIWHLLLKSGARVRRGATEVGGGGVRDVECRSGERSERNSLSLSLFVFFVFCFFFPSSSPSFSFLWWMQGCGSCARPVRVP